MPYFDTHAHLDSQKIADDLHAVITQARNAKVDGILTVATGILSTKRNWEIAKANTGVYFSAGIHPNSVLESPENTLENLQEWLIRNLPVAVGEIGLDRYWHDTPFETQMAFFSGQLELAHAFQLPVLIHCRDAWPDMLSALETQEKRHGPVKGIMHSFSGDEYAAGRCLELGLHLSFSGMATFKKNDLLRKIIADCPLDRMHAETDSPYLTPEPFRGKRNEPSNVPLIVEALARAKNLPEPTMEKALWKNAHALLGIPLA